VEGGLEACPAERADGGDGSAAFSLGDDGVRCGAVVLWEPGRGTVRVGHAGPAPEPPLPAFELDPCLSPKQISVTSNFALQTINISLLITSG
jgi:hypothetical protein